MSSALGLMIHLPTLLVISTLLNLFIGCFLLSIYSQRRQRSFFYWGMACLTFALAEIVASLRVVIDATLLTHTIADILIIISPTLALLGVLWHISPERQAPYCKYIGGFSALFLFAISQQLLISQLFTSAMVSGIFLFTALRLFKTRMMAGFYHFALLLLFALHGLLMLAQAGYLLTQADTAINQLHSNPIMQLILVAHLLLSTCTAMVFPMLYFVRSEAKLINLANFDALTNLYNRRAFFTLGEQVINECIKQRQPIAVMMIDLDYFKQVNDKFGHDAGDAALKWISREIEAHVRSTDVAARIGGEEFALILANTDHETAIRIGQRLRTSVCDSRFKWHDTHIPMSISIGVNCQTRAEKDIKHMLMQADKGLYIAKNRGRNQLVENNDSLTHTALAN